MSQNSKIIDLNRKRAGESYINFNSYLSNDITKENKKKMRSYCRKLPVLIKTNGLLTTLSFIKAKTNDENEYSYIFSWLKSWLNGLNNDNKEKNEEKEDIIKKLTEMDNYKYMIYTKEAIEISIWYKRHAEAMIEN